MLRRRVLKALSDCGLEGYHWGKMTDDQIRNASDEELFNQFGEYQESIQGFKIKIEIERRNLQKMLAASENLRQATAIISADIKRLADSSARIQNLTSTLIAETGNVHSQVVVLTASSHNIEKLTKRLIGLTIVLGILTLVLAADVALKYVPEHLPLTAPQTPPRPAAQSRQ
jgi:hypothetical protein